MHIAVGRHAPAQKAFPGSGHMQKLSEHTVPGIPLQSIATSHRSMVGPATSHVVVLIATSATAIVPLRTVHRWPLAEPLSLH
jgi:hypothetical protein